MCSTIRAEEPPDTSVGRERDTIISTGEKTVGTKEKTEADLPDVSVVIISKNNHVFLDKVVDSINNEVDYPPDKVQLVVLEETDTPVQPVSPAEYHTIPMRHRGFGYARNTALFYARHSIIVFTDDDCLVHQNWLRELVAPLMRSEEVAAVSGAVFVPPCGVVGKCENIIGFPGGGMKYYHQSEGKLKEHPTFSTCNCAVRRSVIDAAGGFDESMKFGGEDERISRHIAKKGKIVYNPDAIVYHTPRDSLKGVFNWFVRRGYADVHHAMVDNKSSYSIPSFLKNAVALRFAVLLIIASVSRLGGVLMLPAVAVYYLLLLRKFSWSFTYYPSWRTLCMVPVVRTLMDTGRDWGILKGLLDVYGRQKNTRIHSVSAGATPRIAFLSNHASIIGGGELSFIDLVDTIGKFDVHPVVFVPGKGEVEHRLKMHGIHAYRYDLPPISVDTVFSTARALLSLMLLLKKHRINIVHTNGARCMLMAGVAGKLLGLPVVWHVRVLERDRWLDYIRAFLADRIIVNSAAVGEAVRPFCRKKNRIGIIHNGIDLREFAEVNPLDLQKTFSLPDAPVVLAVGRLCAWKRFHILIEACGLVNKRKVPFTCLIVGRDAEVEKAYCKRLRAMPVESGIGNVVFGEWRTDVPAIMRAADLLVLPSDNEPFGRVIIEAWACGLPVVATDAGGPKELITDGEDGTLFPVDDTAALATKMERLLTNATLRQTLSEKGKKRAEQFSIEIHARKVREVYSAMGFLRIHK